LTLDGRWLPTAERNELPRLSLADYRLAWKWKQRVASKRWLKFATAEGPKLNVQLGGKWVPRNFGNHNNRIIIPRRKRKLVPSKVISILTEDFCPEKCGGSFLNIRNRNEGIMLLFWRQREQVPQKCYQPPTSAGHFSAANRLIEDSAQCFVGHVIMQQLDIFYIL